MRAHPETFTDALRLQHEIACVEPMQAASRFAARAQAILRVDGCSVDLISEGDGLRVRGAAGIAASLLGKAAPVREYGPDFPRFQSWKGMNAVPKVIQENSLAIGAKSVVVMPIRFCEQTAGLLSAFCRKGTLEPSLPVRMRLLVDVAGGVLAHASELLQERLQGKRVQEALRESERLATLGRESAAIAHELKNPLEAIGNLLYLLEHGSSLDDVARKHVEEARRHLAQLQDVSHQTLGFSRETPKPVPVNISEVLEDVLRFYSRKISYKNVAIERRFEFVREICGYPGELRQLFSNLVVNALEAVERERGRLTIHTSSSRLWSDGRLGVRVSIADNGAGIYPLNRGKIFQPFFTTKSGKGNGLGLWVCREIVRKRGGVIQLHSRAEPGRAGTVFSVFLPENFASGEPDGIEVRDQYAAIRIH